MGKAEDGSSREDGYLSETDPGESSTSQVRDSQPPPQQHPHEQQSGGAHWALPPPWPGHQQQHHHQQQQQRHLANPPRQFPPAWTLHRDLGLSRTFALTADGEAAPLYAVSQHTGWSGQPDLILHSGPSELLPPLAAAERGGASVLGTGNHSTIIIPPLPGLGTATAAAAGAEEQLDYASVIGRLRYRFSVEVGARPGVWRRETFEWRHSFGDAIAGLDTPVADGWKLLRLSQKPPAGLEGVGGGGGAAGGGEKPQFKAGGITSSDGHEVVAAWARLSFGPFQEGIRFRFYGSGEQGVLGERWAIMAVMTALRMYQRHERSRY